MSGVIQRNNFPRLLLGSISKIFGNTYEQLPKTYTKLFENMKSDRAYEEYLELTGLGMAGTKTEGAAIGLDTMKQGLTTKITNYTYGKAISITKEMIDDNQYGQAVLRMSPELAKSIVHAEETVTSNFLNNGFSGGASMADGQQLFSASHSVSGTGGTYANKPTSAVDLSEAALEQAVIDIYGLIGSDGLRIDVTPKDLIIPRQLIFEAHRILKSKLQVDTANNTANALNDMGMLQEVTPWRFLTDTDAWFIRTNVPGGLIFQDRKAPAVESDNEFLTKNNLFSVDRRFGVGSYDQRGIYGSAGA